MGAPVPAPGPSPHRDNNFKVIKFLGKGSYGSVFQVQRLKEPGSYYALKEMDVRTMNQAEREDAVNEIRLLASVGHPNVISYNEAFLDANRLCIIMEYAPDGDLARVIKKHAIIKKTLPEDMIWRYTIQIARGLQALHNMQILHRDIKPGNIMIMANNVVKIGDLGIAKLLKHTMAKTQIGTPHYMPPEVWRNKPYGFSSDSWALGCILYEMATGSVPFVAKSMSELRQKVLRGSYPPISSSYSRDMHSMVKSCLDQNPDRRPSMDQILNSEVVQRHLHLLPSELRSAPPSTASSVMINTIKVPKNIQLIKNKLPAPIYPGMGPISTVIEEDGDDDSAYRAPAQKLPPIGQGGGGGMAAQYAPPLSKGGGDHYRRPLPSLVQQQRDYESSDDAAVFKKPRPMPIQTNAMREQQLQQPYQQQQQHPPFQEQQPQQYGYAPPPWQQQVQASPSSEGGVSESHAAYGAFYRPPPRSLPPPPPMYPRPQQLPSIGQPPVLPSPANPPQYYGELPPIGPPGAGGGPRLGKLPSISPSRQDYVGNLGGVGVQQAPPQPPRPPPPPWNFASGRPVRHHPGARNSGGGPGGYCGADGAKRYGADADCGGGVVRYPPPQWSAPKASRW